jgi:mannose/cellobiose epimerase-like protein (N-acyl-D-glucosamine 2-epimerase family)
MAFSQYSLASGDESAREIALQTYRNILQRKPNPKGRYSKAVPGTRPLISLALPMILANLSMELEWMWRGSLQPGHRHLLARSFQPLPDKERLGCAMGARWQFVDCFRAAVQPRSRHQPCGSSWMS